MTVMLFIIIFLREKLTMSTPLDTKIISKLAEILDKTNLTELEYEDEGCRICLTRNPAGQVVAAPLPPVPAPLPVPPAAAPAAPIPTAAPAAPAPNSTRHRTRMPLNLRWSALFIFLRNQMLRNMLKSATRLKPAQPSA